MATGTRFRFGLMWFDDSSQTSLEEKVARAAQRYRDKFGGAPDTCCVNRNLLPDGQEELWVGAVRVIPLPSILQHHFWLGVMEEAAAPANR
ncbi:MAG: hypothetical protein GX605_03910 [Chloroflexi bacterium]|nr:hypothetical protein [Chloroflexota bacterium]